MHKKIKLGSKVRDKYSGLEGTAVYKCIFLNGCIQYGVQGYAKDGKVPETEGIDEQSLEVIKKSPIKKKLKKVGGPVTHGIRMKGF